jgi:hypothetical protein
VVSASSVRPTWAVVVYGTGPLVGTRLTSWKQWPAVRIHCRAISEPLQPLSRVVPSGLGMFVMRSFTANGYWPSAAGSPSATAKAAVDPATASATATAPVTR